MEREYCYQAYQQLLHFNTVRAKQAWIRDHLRYLLQLTSSHVASDPRDKVYGVLGLLQYGEDGNAQITPDYAKTYEQVCRDATLHLIESEQSFDILVENWQRIGTSWVLDFTRPFCQPPSLLQRGDLNYLENPQNICNTLNSGASGHIKPAFRTEANQLIVQGLEFDTIALVVHIGTDPDGRFNIKLRRRGKTPTLVNELLKSANATEPKFLSNLEDSDRESWLALSWLEQLARSLCPPSLTHRALRTPSMGIEEQFARTVTTDAALRTENSKQLRMRDFNEGSGASDLFRESAWTTLRGRTFFLTKTGFCGVGGREVEEGDTVVVILGASMPFVLRPREQQPGSYHDYRCYHLVGECYVSGIMYGELMDCVDYGVKAEEFRIG